MVPSMKKSCSGDCCPADDSKYAKRQKQRQMKKNKTLLLFSIALTVLVFTRWVLKEDEGSPQERIQRFSKEKMEKLKQAKQLLQEDIRMGLKQGLTGRFDTGAWKTGASNFLRHNDNPKYTSMEEHEHSLAAYDAAILMNEDSGTQWMNPEFLPSLTKEKPLLNAIKKVLRQKSGGAFISPRKFFKVKRQNTKFKWEDLAAPIADKGPKVDFTKHSYKYPEKLSAPPEKIGDYPKLKPLRTLMEDWPQDDIDHPPTPFEEALIHFDYTNSDDVAAAKEFREAKLPFKFVNVPEVVAAGKKWTDEYVNEHFSGHPTDAAPASGKCQESINNFFAFFNHDGWDIETYGLAPTRNNDWTFAKWARHAKYADSARLSPNQPHFYWQAGVDKEERNLPKSKWTFISKDLPSFSSPTETFFVFNPEAQKGIQCRFGERGVTAATHFDAGRNMIAMVTGAKRYILSPPKECSKLGIVPTRGNAMFRHSMLNFGHINLMHEPDMPQDERDWLEESGDAMSLETVLKAGEVLYIPSHWFHYINSLQKSAQCNVRSGVDIEGDAIFGGQADVTDLCEPGI
ncbi:unnamed protein product [Cylindrotheca closterium]|uniref:JmjC domain-containing protein n=1 Tax=Cylindrotheca closterium TaxID=2856 RepID=A0AAD2CD25_9STRA|nr:unnamed protein product [Cylindrotheca closterium]